MNLSVNLSRISRKRNLQHQLIQRAPDGPFMGDLDDLGLISENGTSISKSLSAFDWLLKYIYM